MSSLMSSTDRLLSARNCGSDQAVFFGDGQYTAQDRGRFVEATGISQDQRPVDQSLGNDRHHFELFRTLEDRVHVLQRVGMPAVGVRAHQLGEKEHAFGFICDCRSLGDYRLEHRSSVGRSELEHHADREAGGGAGQAAQVADRAVQLHGFFEERLATLGIDVCFLVAGLLQQCGLLSRVVGELERLHQVPGSLRV